MKASTAATVLTGRNPMVREAIRPSIRLGVTTESNLVSAVGAPQETFVREALPFQSHALLGLTRLLRDNRVATSARKVYSLYILSSFGIHLK